MADLFPARERWLLLGVLTISVVSAGFEVVGVASILPFMALVVDPTAIGRYAALGRLTAALGARSPTDALVILGIATAAIVALGNAFAALNAFVQARFNARTLARVTSQLFEGYLSQPYAFHVRRDAPSLLKVLLSDAYLVASGVVAPAILAVSRSLMAIGVLALLFVQEPRVAVVVGVVVGLAYGLVFRAVRERHLQLGAAASNANLERHRVSQEGLGGIKELQALGRERLAIDCFRDAARTATTAQATDSVVSQVPRFVLEPIAFGGIILVTLTLLTRGGSSAQSIVPVLALYAFAGYRLLPAIQQVFASAMSVRFNLPILDELHSDYIEVVQRGEGRIDTEGPSLPFRREIIFQGVSLWYENAATPAIANIDLRIQPKERIALVGRTGAGKTTFADLLLGLHEPTSGRVLIDGVTLAERSMIRGWRRRIGYVPQHVFLGNSSVAENIAFGVPASRIDSDAVHQAARLAQAEDFIEALPHGYGTVVGERGVKLSGGQRQRIGIARALYDQPEMLIFDEATSSLDGLTEEAVMDAIRSLGEGRTIILIAHRMSTVRVCDRIILLSHGAVKADGSYEELLKTSADFRELLGRADGN